MKKLALFSFAALATAGLFAEVTITGVSARQRWPWNNLVDVDFTIGGAAQGEAYYVDVSATYDNGNRSLVAKTFETEPIAATGKNRVVWNLGADYPNFKADDLRVTVTVTPFSDSTPLYLVVDMSSGLEATSWPVRYTTTAPVHTAGVEDPCKTTEMWFKRVKAGTIGMGLGAGSTGSSPYYPSHTCVLTNDYYLGVFALTQFQSKWLGMSSDKMRDQGCAFTNETCRMTRPADSLRYPGVRANYFDSSNPATEIPSGGVLKTLNDKTSLVFDMPTEWQWEYACRAGSTGSTYEGAVFRYSENSYPPKTSEIYSLWGDWDASYGTSYVDEYSPNPWGFYGMLGNVREICRNYPQTITQGETVVEPQGDAGNTKRQIAKGGSWNEKLTSCYAFAKKSGDPSNESAYYWGVRFCLTIKKTAE